MPLKRCVQRAVLTADLSWRHALGSLLRRGDCMQQDCIRDPGSPTDSCEAVVMHFDVAAASPTPRPNPGSPPEQTPADLSAPGSPSGGPLRSGRARDESTKTKEFCKVRWLPCVAGEHWRCHCASGDCCSPCLTRRLLQQQHHVVTAGNVSGSGSSSLQPHPAFAGYLLASARHPGEPRAHSVRHAGRRLLAEPPEGEDVLPPVPGVPLPCAC